MTLDIEIHVDLQDGDERRRHGGAMGGKVLADFVKNGVLDREAFIEHFSRRYVAGKVADSIELCLRDMPGGEDQR